ncbi:MAG: PfkB family carbohydrate kinase [Planctomycetota bacterium]
MNDALKIVPADRAAALVRDSQSAGQSVVMCHGCFDIVHPGHIRHLQHAARQGDRLLVSIMGDALLDKGSGRPLIPQELRAENLAALDCVDWVVISAATTAVELLDQIRPDIYVKGREYETNRDPRFRAERETVERHGGRVVFSSGDVVFSSTALIGAIEETASPFHARLRQLIEHHDVTPATVEPVIDSFRGRRVLVVGETIIDTYVMCDRPDVAGEGPIMTLRPIERRSFDAGAAVIARHVAAMGAEPVLLTAQPRTPEAERLRQRLAIERVPTRWIDVDDSIIEKQRFLVGQQKVMKLDLGDPLTLDAAHQRQLVHMAAETADSCDAVIIADFGQGLLTAATLETMCAAVRPRVGVLAGDVSGRRSSLLSMLDMDLICPSEAELRDAFHDYDVSLNTVVWRALERTRARAALITMGDEGLIAFTPRSEGGEPGPEWGGRLNAEHVPSLAPFAVDQLGCGDALLAAATLTLVAGGSVALAAVLGSVAASVQANRLGNVVVGAHDLRQGVRRLSGAQLAYRADAEPRLSIEIDDQLRAAYS